VIPVVEPIEAIDALLLLHLPPVVALVIVVTLPTHKDVSPTMLDGAGLTFTVAIREQPRAV
jgi:hypothetical protein